MGFLSEVPLFRRLPRAQYPLLASVLREHRWAPGETVVLRGQMLTEFSFIKEGWAEVESMNADATVETLNPGDYFGERLLEEGGSCHSPARVVASPQGLVTLSLTAAEFEDLGLRKHLRIPRRRALGRSSDGEQTLTTGRPVGKPRARSEAERRFIADAVRANANLRSLVDLKEEAVQRIVDAAYREEVPARTEVVHRGEYGGVFYIVESGRFELRLTSPGGSADAAEGSSAGITRQRSGFCLELHAASEMGRRQARKERFLQTLIHSKETSTAKRLAAKAVSSDCLSPPDTGSTASPCGSLGATSPSALAPHGAIAQDRMCSTPSRKTSNQWRCNSWMPGSVQADDALECGRRWKDKRPSSFQILGDPPQTEVLNASRIVDTSLQGRKPALVSPRSQRQLRWPGRSAVHGVPKLLPREGAFGVDSTPTPDPSSRRLKTWPADQMLLSSEDSRSSLRPCGSVLGVREPGDSFGEVALLYHAPRTSTAVACEDSVVWCVSQAAFRKVLLKDQTDRNRGIVAHLEKVDLFQGLLSHEKLELAQNFLTETFRPGDWIVREGEVQNVWYILVHGECELLGKSGEDEDIALATLTPFGYFGERAILRGKPSEFSVRVLPGEEARCLVLDGPTFKDLVGILLNDAEFRHAIEDELVEFAEYKCGKRSESALSGFLPRLQTVHSLQQTSCGRSPTPTSSPLREANRPRARTAPADLDRPERPMRLDPAAENLLRALDRICILGTGAFGAVTLEEDPDTAEMFALKTVSKGLVQRNCMQESVRSEREILTMIDSPFCIRLNGTFKDDEYVYFLFEPLLGGDLHGRIHKEPEVFGRPAVFRFIIACLVCALGHLHQRSIVFRDLKPENVLLDSSGYAKLCDFGFAKFVLGRTLTLCGTPEYMAPEVIRNLGYNRMVDWWALGVLTYELIYGETPFAADVEDGDDPPPEVVFCNILEGIEAVKCPFLNINTTTFNGEEAWAFVRGLLKYSPGGRLGIGGPAQVAGHEFLRSVDVAALERWEIKPPDPRLSTSEFISRGVHMEDADMPEFVEYVDDGSGWDIDF